MNLAHSSALEDNKALILEILKKHITSEGRLLEIGSGTAEQAVYFAKQLPKTHWVTSDIEDKHPAITAQLKKARLANLHGPELLRVGEDDLYPFRCVIHESKHETSEGLMPEPRCA